jgi:hypothetical protein
MKKIGCLSLRRLRERGIDVEYSALKSYFQERRTLPEYLFLDLCRLAGIDTSSLKIEKLSDHWGKIIGGKR